MALFGDSKQEGLDNLANSIFTEINLLSQILDANNGSLNSSGRARADRIETLVVDFCLLCQQYQSTHNQVKWMGQKTLINGVLMAITGFLGEVTRSSGHQFTKLQ